MAGSAHHRAPREEQLHRATNELLSMHHDHHQRRLPPYPRLTDPRPYLTKPSPRFSATRSATSASVCPITSALELSRGAIESLQSSVAASVGNGEPGVVECQRAIHRISPNLCCTSTKLEAWPRHLRAPSHQRSNCCAGPSTAFNRVSQFRRRRREPCVERHRKQSSNPSPSANPPPSRGLTIAQRD